MKTGIVINNYDPTFKNRCQIRIHGLHTQTIGGKYLIIDDDLPWVSPAPSTISSGTSSIPQVGSKVYVDDSRGNFVYYGQVELKADIKRLLHKNADISDRINIISYQKDLMDGYWYIFLECYVPFEGLKIICGKQQMNSQYCEATELSMNYNGYHIEKLTGMFNELNINNKNVTSSISIQDDNIINIKSNKQINLDCDDVNLSKNAINGVSNGVIDSEKLMSKFNSHVHLAPYGMTSPPTSVKLEPNDLKDDIKLA